MVVTIAVNTIPRRVDEKPWNDTLDGELLGVHSFERNDSFAAVGYSF